MEIQAASFCSTTLANGDVGGPAAEVSLRGNNLVIVRAQFQSSGGPRVEVVCGRDGSTGALGLADGPVLVEGRGTDDGRRVYALGLVDVVCSSVGGDGALPRGTGGRVISAEVFDDVVLDERVGGPAVDGEVTVAVGVVGTTVLDCPRTHDLVSVFRY